MNNQDKQKYIFGSLFLLANKLQVKGDAYLADDEMTTKQWFLIVMISQFKDTPPMLSEVANLMGSTRQNVKQLALKLEEKGFLVIEKDQSDNRILRLRLTEKNNKFWDKRDAKDNSFVENLFKNFTKEEIDVMYHGIEKMLEAVKDESI